MRKFKLKRIFIFLMIMSACANLSAQNTKAASSQRYTSQYQTKKVSGIVLDKNNVPITGANVSVKSDKKGTTPDAYTDIEGKFSFSVPENATVKVSCIGYVTKEVELSGNSVLKVILEDDTKSLDEIVVIGYGESTRKDLTGSVSSLKADAISKIGVSDFSSAMQGRLTGVKINTQSGEAGASVNITIRGSNSINAGTDPLYVIDGMQIDVNESEVATSGVGGNTKYNPLSTINPNDIESIDVLKDASATAIYGSRGANGVILITTKSGKSMNRTDINADINAGINTVSNKIEMLNAQDFVNYKFLRGGSDLVGYGIDTDGDGTEDTPVDASNYEQFNWQDLLIRTGISQNYNISANAVVNKKTKISSNIGYYDQLGIIKSNEYKRLTARLKIDHEATDKLSYGISANLGRNVTDGAMSSGGSGTGGYSGLVQLIYTERPIKLYTPTEESEIYTNGYIDLNSMVGDEAYRNIVFTRLMGNAYVNYKFTPELKLSVNASGNTSLSKLQEYYSSKSLWGRSYGGYGSIKNVNTDGYTLTGTLNYNKLFNKKHRINALFGMEMNGYHFEDNAITARSFSDETTGVFDISKGASSDLPTSNVTEVIRESIFFRAAYDYRSKYYATINFRQDASSNFPSASRIGYFPSLSLAWRVNSERFMSNAKWINNLKLRASAGATGNDRISTYGSMARMSTAYYGSAGTTLQGLVPTSSENPKLKWETTYQYDLGLDLDLFNSRISFVGDAYYKDTRDMLFNANVPAQTGFNTQWQNIGRMTNKGIELSLTTRNIAKKNFSWTSSVTFDLNRNKVTSLGDSEYLPVTIGNGFFTQSVARVIKGQSIGTGYGYLFDGNYQVSDFVWTDKSTNEVIDPSAITSDNMNSFKYVLKEGVASIKSLSVKPGDRKYKNLNDNEDNTIDDKDRTIISHSLPKFNYGINNEFHYKNFDLNFFLEGVYGNQIMNAFRYQSESNNTLTMYNISKDYFQNRWTPENPTNKYAALLSQSNNLSSSYYVEDASFLRLKTVNIGYTFGKQLTKKMGVQALRVYVNMDNLFIITKYTGMDPDVQSTNSLFLGYDRLSYPRTRNYMFGINLTL